MKKLLVSIVICSVISSFYAFYIRIQAINNLISLDKLDVEVAKKLTDDSLEPYFASIYGSSNATIVNVWIVLMLNLAILSFAIVMMFGSKKSK